MLGARGHVRVDFVPPQQKRTEWLNLRARFAEEEEPGGSTS